MEITPLHIVSSFKDKHTLVKGLIYIKLLEKEIYLPDNYLNILALFSMYEEISKVVEEAMKRNFYKSEQTVENSISKLVGMELLEKKGTKNRKIGEHILEAIPSEHIITTYKIHNLNAEL